MPTIDEVAYCIIAVIYMCKVFIKLTNRFEDFSKKFGDLENYCNLIEGISVALVSQSFKSIKWRQDGQHNDIPLNDTQYNSLSVIT
jgi:hypothetical protein